MLVDGHERLHDEYDEAQVVHRRLAGAVEQYARVGGQAPVVVLAAAVDAFEGLFVQQTAETVLVGHLLHQTHDEHVVIHGEVGFLKDGGQLKLVGSHLVVARLAGDAQLERLYFKVFHEGGHTLGDGAEVVVVHLLVFGAGVAHEGASGQQHVGACAVEPFVHEEVFLLPAQVGDHLVDFGVEVAGHLCGGFVHGFDGLLEGRFVVECFTRVGDEHGGDHQRVADDEHGGGGVPCRVAAGLEGGADAARGERRGVGLLLYELLAREFLHEAAFAVVLHEAVVLLCGAFGEGLEPVGAVRHAELHGPLLHAGGHGVCGGQVERGAVVDDVAHLAEDVFRPLVRHFLSVEHVFGEKLAGTFFAVGDFDGLLLESLFYNAKSDAAGHSLLVVYWGIVFIQSSRNREVSPPKASMRRSRRKGHQRRTCSLRSMSTSTTAVASSSLGAS